MCGRVWARACVLVVRALCTCLLEEPMGGGEREQRSESFVEVVVFKGAFTL